MCISASKSFKIIQSDLTYEIQEDQENDCTILHIAHMPLKNKYQVNTGFSYRNSKGPLLEVSIPQIRQENSTNTEQKF